PGHPHHPAGNSSCGRSRRQALVHEAVAQLPAGTDAAQRRAAVDAHLHRHAMLRAEQQVFDRPLAKAAETARRALPCEDCGTGHAGGPCAPGECVDLALAASADLADHRDVNATARRTEADLRAEMVAARPAGAGREDVLGSDLQTARDAVDTYRADALARLARTPLADAEAELAHDTALRANRHRLTAQTNADQARATTARYLLLERPESVRALRNRANRIRSTASAGREAILHPRHGADSGPCDDRPWVPANHCPRAPTRPGEWPADSYQLPRPGRP
ncbi:hypothetical protein ABT238_37490, partial [Kitasatospora sp. NPDC001527]